MQTNTPYSDIFSKQRYSKGTQSLQCSIILTPPSTFLLEKQPFLSYSRNHLLFMETEGSLP